MRQSLLAVLVQSVLLIVVALPCAYAAKGENTPQTFDIPPGTLDAVLQRFLLVADANIMYSRRDVHGLISAGAKGRLSDRQALQGILAGTGFMAIEATPSSFVLRKVEVPTDASDGARDERPTQLDAITVVGSRLPRISLQTSSPFVVISRKEILSSGRSSLAEILAQQPSLKLHRALDISVDSGAGGVPLAMASGVSLNELGPGATLILVDGKRWPNYPSVFTELGSIPDLSALPVSFIERVEISSSGGSAVYGSDAMAGVINIVLRNDVSGAEIMSNGGISARGDAGRSNASMLIGDSLPGDASFLIGLDVASQNGVLGKRRGWVRDRARNPAGVDARIPLGEFIGSNPRFQPGCPGADELTARTCRLDRALYTSLVPDASSLTGRAFYSRKFSTFEVTADLFIGRRKIDMVMAPAVMTFLREGQFTNHAYFDVGPVESMEDATSYGLTFGAKGGWHSWEWDFSFFRRAQRADIEFRNGINIQNALAAVGNEKYRIEMVNPAASVDLVRAIDPNVRGQSWVQGGAFSILGQPFSIAARPVTMLVGVESRLEGFHYSPAEELFLGLIGGAEKGVPEFDDHRRALSAFAELGFNLPRDISVELATRIDKSDRFGSKVTPKFGLKWDVNQAWSLRGSIAGGYREPSSYELRQIPEVQGLVLLDPARVRGRCTPTPLGCPAWLRSESNAGLRPERSRSARMGLLWSPSESFYAGLDYYQLKRSQEIGFYNVFSSEGEIPEASWQLDEIGMVQGILIKPTNDYRTMSSGLQVEVIKRFFLQSGRLSASIFGDCLQRFRRDQLGGGDLAGREVPRLRLRARFSWENNGWNTSLAANFRGAFSPLASARSLRGVYYDASQEQPVHKEVRIASMTSLDLAVAYQLNKRWSVDLSINNIADRYPLGRDGNFSGQSFQGDDPLGRYFSLRLSYVYK